MPNRDLDREILELGFTGQPTPIIPQDVALDYMLGLRKLANALAPPPEKPPAQTPTMSASGPIPVPEVGTETPEAVIDRDQALTLAQTQAELEATSAKAKELQEQLMEAERVTNQAQVTAEMSQAQAGEAMEAATSATANAAAQADAKMRLSMRINEMRQQLSVQGKWRVQVRLRPQLSRDRKPWWPNRSRPQPQRRQGLVETRSLFQPRRPKKSTKLSGHRSMLCSKPHRLSRPRRARRHRRILI